MAKILLLSFDPEARKARQQQFEALGYGVLAAEPKPGPAAERAQKERPDVIAVDCGQLPSLCRQTADALRNGASTKGVPIVLFNVAEHDIERTRLEVAGGVVAYDYELTDRLRSAVFTRIANQTAEEVAAQRAAEEKLAARRAARAAKRPEAPPKPPKPPKPEKAPKAPKPEKAPKGGAKPKGGKAAAKPVAKPKAKAAAKARAPKGATAARAKAATPARDKPAPARKR